MIKRNTDQTRKCIPQSNVHSAYKLLSAVAISLWLSACGGGISGTGDGGPQIIIESVDSSGNTGNPGDSGSADSTGATTGGGDSGNVDASPTTASPTTPNVPTPDLSMLVPETLLQARLRNDGVSATQPFIAQLVAVSQDVSATFDAFDSVQTNQTDVVSGPFNKTLSFSQNGTDTTLAWADTTQLRFLLTINSERAIHVLQENNKLTIRRVDRINNAVFHAIVKTLPEGSVVEADLNNNGDQKYLQTYSGPQFTAAYMQHPTDTAITRQRELIEPSGAVSVVQNCSANSQNCNDDSAWSNPSTSASTQLTEGTTQINSAIPTATLPQGLLAGDALPDNVTEAVVAATQNQQPTESEIQCGLQQVDNNVRAFCLQPLPLVSELVLFGEQLSGGQIFYQLQ